MTNKEAIKGLKALSKEFSGYKPNEEMFDMAIKALEGEDKDVPRRKGVFIPDITVEMFRNASLESIEDLMASGEMEDILLPSAQPEQRWIPVSERLPEDEYVLISKKPTKISGDKRSVAIAIRTADPRSRKVQWRDSGFGVIQDDKVLAWMPLPEPWKGNDE